MPKLTGFSHILLLVSYMTFGWHLHSAAATRFAWVMTVCFVIALAGMMTTLWKPVKSFALLGFRSDVGYFVMVLLSASLAVLVLSWVHFFAYILVMIAASLLVRIEARTLDLSNLPTFLILVGLSITGLGLSWLPLFVTPGVR